MGASTCVYMLGLLLDCVNLFGFMVIMNIVKHAI